MRSDDEFKVCANRKCLKSGIPQPVHNFHFDKSRIDGLHVYCKSCISSRNVLKSKNKAPIELNEQQWSIIQELPYAVDIQHIRKIYQNSLKLSKCIHKHLKEIKQIKHQSEVDQIHQLCFNLLLGELQNTVIIEDLVKVFMEVKLD